ncbi:ead/Ea22-like family protein [Salmonella enterica subsp. enterica serovar Mississippi]|nr:ead/Ea22-like family protein [Salmonella enterica]ECL8868909.1 ead/Ea22-like family protein [Salmonella enterica subsp. enterica serovar Ibadan]EDV5650201.1 ead/Ea22-like family protein [Salmonella enterica subsp. enterica]EGI5663933.1 ead/Ea22-like family protein [Salmonella enterica subsp. enterica serovar Mississippi]
MTALNKQALRQKAVKAGGEEWQSRKAPGIGGEYTVIVKGSLVKHQGWSTHRPVADEVVDKKTMDFIAAANPATFLALLDENESMARDLISRNGEIEGLRQRIAELEARTVNLPAACADDEYFIDGVFQALRYERDVERAISAAGIKVKGE